MIGFCSADRRNVKLAWRIFSIRNEMKVPFPQSWYKKCLLKSYSMHFYLYVFTDMSEWTQKSMPIQTEYTKCCYYNLPNAMREKAVENALISFTYLSLKQNKIYTYKEMKIYCRKATRTRHMKYIQQVNYEYLCVNTYTC